MKINNNNNQLNFNAHIKLKPSDISKLAIGTGALSIATTSAAEAGISIGAMNPQSVKFSNAPLQEAVNSHNEILISTNNKDENFYKEVASEASLLPTSAGVTGAYASTGGSNAISAVIDPKKLDKIETLSIASETYSSSPKAQLSTALSGILASGAIGLYSGDSIFSQPDVNEYEANMNNTENEVSKLVSYGSIATPLTAMIASSSSNVSEAQSSEFIAKTLAGIDTEEENPS